jgi:hypothetical protein
MVRLWSPHASFSAAYRLGGMAAAAAKGGARSVSMNHSFQAHAGAVTSIALHPRVEALVTSGLDGFIKMFSLNGFHQILNLQVISNG